jgi:sec-independent protein translocase protein TatA
MIGTFPSQIGIPGGPELLLVLLIGILLFGASKIPKLARSSGEAIGEFKKGRKELQQELEEMRNESDSDNSNAAGDQEPQASADQAPTSADTADREVNTD